jgi:DNA polymerase III subunit epsilon
VYLAMTGGQSALALDQAVRAGVSVAAGAASASTAGLSLQVVEASSAELAAHEEFMQRVSKASGGKALWQ